MKKIVSTNPGRNYEVIGEVIASTNSEIKKKVDDANNVKQKWSDLGIKKRIEIVNKAYLAYKADEKQIAELITKEVGTPITECRSEVNWNWSYVNWFIKNVESAIGEEITFEDKTSLHKILYEPIGTTAVITPWNLPFDLFIWGVLPNLLVGNTVVYKASEECILTGKFLEEISSRVGFPNGVLSFIHGDAEEGMYLTEQDIDLIWFTGSTEVGKKIYQLSGVKFIRSVLEMGGSNPAVVFKDADIDLSVNSILSSRFMFCGQTCDADKRLIVHESKYEEFVEKFVEKVKSLVFGDPEDKNTQIGPLVSKKQLDLLISQVDDAKRKGAKVLTGGEITQNFEGAYYYPTILTNIRKTMRVWKEEVFGPVLPIITFTSEEEAISLANDTLYGLGSDIYSEDKKKLLKVAEKLKAGNVTFNGCNHFKPFNPFGGYKNSGMGREHGIVGFRELCQIKTISMNK